MVLDLHQNFFSAQYLKNKLTDFHQIIQMRCLNFKIRQCIHKSEYGLLHVIFGTFVTELWPLIYAIFSTEYLENKLQIFTRLYICIHIYKNWTRIVTRNFHIFVLELWPLIYAKTLFTINILRTNLQIFTKIILCIHMDKI